MKFLFDWLIYFINSIYYHLNLLTCLIIQSSNLKNFTNLKQFNNLK